MSPEELADLQARIFAEESLPGLLFLREELHEDIEDYPENRDELKTLGSTLFMKLQVAVQLAKENSVD